MHIIEYTHHPIHKLPKLQNTAQKMMLHIQKLALANTTTIFVPQVTFFTITSWIARNNAWTRSCVFTGRWTTAAWTVLFVRLVTFLSVRIPICILKNHYNFSRRRNITFTFFLTKTKAAAKSENNASFNIFQTFQCSKSIMWLNRRRTYIPINSRCIPLENTL